MSLTVPAATYVPGMWVVCENQAKLCSILQKNQKNFYSGRKLAPINPMNVFPFFQVNTLHQHGMLTLSTKKSKTIQSHDVSKFQVSKTTETRAMSKICNSSFPTSAIT